MIAYLMTNSLGVVEISYNERFKIDVGNSYSYRYGFTLYKSIPDMLEKCRWSNCTKFFEVEVDDLVYKINILNESRYYSNRIKILSLLDNKDVFDNIRDGNVALYYLHFNRKDYDKFRNIIVENGYASELALLYPDKVDELIQYITTSRGAYIVSFRYSHVRHQLIQYIDNDEDATEWVISYKEDFMNLCGFIKKDENISRLISFHPEYAEFLGSRIKKSRFALNYSMEFEKFRHIVIQRVKIKRHIKKWISLWPEDAQYFMDKGLI